MDSGDADQEVTFRRLFHEAYGPLLAYALRRTRRAVDAEEIVADTLLVAWRRREELPHGSDAIPWLYGVARHVLANQSRARRRRARLERLLLSVTRSPTEPDEASEGARMTRAVVAASLRLSEVDQEVLRLSAWEGLTNRQLALSLGCSENAAALRLRRARERLRKELLKEGWLPGQEVVEATR